VSEGKKKRAAAKKKRAAPRRRGKEGAGREPVKGAAKSGRARTPAGMPAPESIVSETIFKSPKGNVYRMIQTDEVDEYEEGKDGDG
jgi:hypothetical protein